MIPGWLVKDGNFTIWVQAILTLGGAAIALIGLKYDSTLRLALLGFLLAAIGGFSSRAHMLKIKPFDNSYKKARESYKVKDDDEQEAK